MPLELAGQSELGLSTGRTLKGAWGEPPPNLENFAVSQGKIGSKMYFNRAIYWTKDHWSTAITRKKVTDKSVSQGNPPQKISEVTSLAIQQRPISRYSVISFRIRSADSLTDYSRGVKLVD